ncbi:acyl-homoserine-lactone synthase [Pantoea sp.]|uniref:acyl-homoserine-lactone synthase n=1 Tax=Pantoea sp. TaxID=69393 RepID=UPI00289FEAE8|nr:acyl-homoserine-lactone synthase [Pantoea sp.]
MSRVVEFFSMNFEQLSHPQVDELYRLRHETFKTRLDWQVNSINGLEYDAYDTKNASYLFGMAEGEVVCSARFINTQHKTMLSDIFSDYFQGLNFPVDGNYVEVTRLFIDKKKRTALELCDCPISKMIFIAMIKYCHANNCKGMYAIVSQAMFAIFKRSGWNIDMLKTGVSEKNEKIYFIYMPADEEDIKRMIDKEKNQDALSFSPDGWPLAFRV